MPSIPPSVSLSALSWSTPDGTPLFNDLTLSFARERTGIVGRNGAGKSTLLRLIAGDLPPKSGAVRLSGTLARMRQEALEQQGDTIADLFGQRAAFDVLERAEVGRASAQEVAEADWTLPARIEAALVRCGLGVEPQTPLAVLSGGQRSRASLAALIFAEPDFLLLDEPTNNLDGEGRRAVIEVVKGWRGGVIIASHDRDLLEEMDAIVELTTLGATRYGGNYSAFRALKDAQLEAAARDLAHAEKTSKNTARRAQQAAERKARKDSAGHKSRAKGGQPKVQLDAAKERAEASLGAGVRLREARQDASDKALTAAREKIEVLQPLRMDIPSSGLASGKTVLRLTGLSGGYDPARPIIRDLSLTLTGPERVVLSGPNGSGKTTLLKLVAGEIAPHSGLAEVMVPFALLDQHVTLLDPARTLHDNFRHLNPEAQTHTAHSALARFGFRAGDALRRAGDLSGGERLRAGLACTLAATPAPMLLMLDEPTNHLDLEGIAALEAALEAYDGAVLAISHDAAFLRALAPDRTVKLGD